MTHTHGHLKNVVRSFLNHISEEIPGSKIVTYTGPAENGDFDMDGRRVTSCRENALLNRLATCLQRSFVSFIVRQFAGGYERVRSDELFMATGVCQCGVPAIDCRVGHVSYAGKTSNETFVDLPIKNLYGYILTDSEWHRLSAETLEQCHNAHPVTKARIPPEPAVRYC
ncbi:hypothetical protein HK102_001563 [Quaeritorhiza haematococci]|nr:hypothetical protein HK102_001563 [Quaeritorhiza haematococci]